MVISILEIQYYVEHDEFNTDVSCTRTSMRYQHDTCIFRVDIVNAGGDVAVLDMRGHAYSLCGIIEVEDHSKEAYL